MKQILLSFCIILFVFNETDAQRRTASTNTSQAASSARSAEIGQMAVVLDEKLSVLRDQPSLSANAIQRMRRGRNVKILNVRNADGVVFYYVNASPESTGWVQSDALFGKFRSQDESRLAALVIASSGFEKLDLAVYFFSLYPKSEMRPAILLLFGDEVESACETLSRNANRQLNLNEMAATGAPLHSYFLNFVSLDRYRRIGIKFVFNTETRKYHYDGAAWNEILKNHSKSKEADEAKNRIESLKEKMERTNIR